MALRIFTTIAPFTWMGGKIRILDYNNTSANESFMAEDSEYTFETSGNYELYSLEE